MTARTGHPFAYPADAAGHILHFQHLPERDHKRTALCRGCSWQMPAPGTGYMRFRVEHSRHHEGLDRAGLLRGIAIAVPVGLAMWAALGLLITRWW